MRHFRGKNTAFLKALRATFGVAPAADKVGIHRSTIYRWMESDAEFAQAVRETKEACFDDLEARHFEAAKLTEGEQKH